MRRPLLSVAFLLCALCADAAPDASAAPPRTRPVLIVGNNWAGTADVLDVPTYRRIARINIVPDKAQREAEIMLDPVRYGVFLFTRQEVGEGHDQYVDDMFASHDGRTLFVSRPSFDDVVAISLKTRKIVWRTQLTGARSDHAAISPDGRHFVVSSPSAAGPAYVDVLDTRTGKIVGKFPSGDTPHENNFSRDGKRIFHASIGRVYTATDDPSEDATKGTRVFEVVDARTLQVLKRWDMGKKLAEAGHPNMSSAVRPMALSPDEKWLYFQVSFFHGFVEFDLRKEKVTRLAHLPTTKDTPQNRQDYILDSAHHGIAMDGAGTKLCVAGTSSNYAAIVHRRDFRYKLFPLGARTYWSTTSQDGRFCYVSVAGDDTMAVFSYAQERQVARVPVGDHPQRARTAQISTAIFGVPARLRPRGLSLRARPARDRSAPYRFRLAGRLDMPDGANPDGSCEGRVRLALAAGGGAPVRRTARLRARGRDCVYAATLTARRPGALRASARFPGNGALLPRATRARRLRAG